MADSLFFILFVLLYLSNYTAEGETEALIEVEPKVQVRRGEVQVVHVVSTVCFNHPVVAVATSAAQTTIGEAVVASADEGEGQAG